MAPTTEETYLVNLLLVCILYGVYLPMYFETMRVLPADPAWRDGWSFKKTLSVTSTILALVETFSVVLNLLRCYDRFISSAPGRPQFIGIGIVCLGIHDNITSLIM
jgi:hypothetical protein